MKRMKTIVAGLALAALSLTSPALAGELRLAHFVSPQHPYQKAFEWFGEELAAKTGGEVTVRIYPGGELGSNPADYVNMAIDGIADMTFILPGYTPAQFPRTLVMELPGALKDEARGPQGYLDAADMVAEDFRRVHPVALWTNSYSGIFTRGRPVRALSDMAGLKIRVASAPMSDLVEAWGATPVFMPVTELYTALQTGVVDGAVIDSGAALVFKLGEVAQYMTVGWQANVGTFGLLMNRDSYAALGENQAAFDELAAGLGRKAYEVWGGLAQKGMQLYRGEGHELIELTPEAAAEFDRIGDRVRQSKLDELQASGIPGPEILAKMRGE